MTPAISSARYVSQVHCPSLVAPLRAALEFLDPWPRRHHPLINEPPLQSKHSTHRLAVHADPLGEAQQRPQPSITKSRMQFDQALESCSQHLIEPWRCRLRNRARPQPSAGKIQHSTHFAHRYAGPRRHDSSGVPGVIGRSLAASHRISRSIVSSPTSRLSRLSSSSRGASSSFGRARSAFSAPSKPIAPVFQSGHLSRDAVPPQLRPNSRRYMSAGQRTFCRRNSADTTYQLISGRPLSCGVRVRRTANN